MKIKILENLISAVTTKVLVPDTNTNLKLCPFGLLPLRTLSRNMSLEEERQALWRTVSSGSTPVTWSVLLSIRFSPVIQSCPTLCDTMDCSTPDCPVHQVLEPTQNHVHHVGDASNHLICHPLLLLSIFPSIRVFSNESVLHIKWPKYWSFSFSINPSNQYSGLISFRIDWWDLLAVQGTLKSLLQHHSSKASILQCSAFFMVQLSHPYVTTGKTIALTRQAFVDKVMSCF